ncbi:hypothetical protein SAMN05660690_4298 [Geodermatophilus telluris]|uniref:Serine-threonine protein kinase n=1 Tax=Geodermatophilus telluris TaxID=1190417 RepID=A0A1G6V105_9ACTN|nr:hypothetical protein [Geodermatophilus telluris]SDD47218.1 hypothetical protein SAMN05660690_4298 [Geodermatophilus telluris]
MDRVAGRPFWRLHFTGDGGLARGAAEDLLRRVADEGVTDLVVLCHGWNTGPDDAEDLYGSLGPLVARQAARAEGLGRVGLVGVHWPAIWWPDGPGAAARPHGSGDALSPGDALSTGDGPGDEPGSPAEVPGPVLAAALRPAFEGEEQRSALDRLGALIEEGEAAAASGVEPDAAQRARLAEFSALLTRLLPADPTPEEDAGERDFLDRGDDPEAYVELARAFGSVPEGGAAQGAGDVFRTVWRGARDGLRVFSYYTMKSRAGVVGARGLAPVLVRLHATEALAAVRVHLVGHSFGARLVSFALQGIPSADASPVASLVLVQGAFSHFSFATARGNPFGRQGALQPCADRVHGPLVATFSAFDWAVGRWYPKASALARQDNQADPDVSRWGALGSGGFRAVRPLESVDMLAPGRPYPFTAGSYYAVDGSGVIADRRQSAFAGAHSDIRHPEVAWLVAAAAAAGARAAG